MDVTLLAVLVAGTTWLVKQFLGIDPGHCPEVREWWHLRARVCGYMPYAVPVAGVLIPPVYRVLFFVEIAAVLGLAFIILNGVNLLNSLNKDVSAALVQPTLTPTALI